MDLPNFTDVQAAAERIRPLVKRTPVMTCNHLNELSGAELLFKCENFQTMGAFKFRGACNALFGGKAEDLSGGVVTQSSGNHGAALALAARRRGIPAHVVMPENSVPVKVEAVRGYGATVHFCAANQTARDAMTAQIQAQTGAVLVHPYNDSAIIAGQGTAALELLDEVGRLDVLMAPVGGGGLMSGTALAGRGVDQGMRIVGAEPAGADDAWRSLRAGVITPVEKPDTIADGLRATLGPRPFVLLTELGVEILTVDEAAIVAAMRLIWERMKLVIEPSSAVPLAAVLSYPEQFAGRRVGIILTGGNVDLGALPW
ncbi:MAG: pyridoxal-phosphate dependent enzyme [Gammaproteobacteria bacterium]|nr:pyridoxal-phosphate dependent enzyme [Gammaproteobacteria bacterium]